MALLGLMLGVGAGGMASPLYAADPLPGQSQYRLNDGQWQLQNPVDPASPEGQLQAARKALAEEKADRAKSLARQWIKHYPNHPLMPEAILIVGDAKVMEHNYYDSLFDYEAVIKGYPGSEAFGIALEREYQIARLYAGGVKRRILGLPLVTAKEEAEELFILIQERAPGSEVGEQASLALAELYFNRGQMENASEAYDLFLLNYPQSAHREAGMLRLIQSQLATFKGPDFDARGLIDAGQRIRMYQAEFPAAAEKLGAETLLARIDESLASKTYRQGRWYEKVDKLVSATAMYRRVLKDWPQTAAARQAMERLAAIVKDRPLLAADVSATSAPDTSATQPEPAPQPE